ncbi:MAG TPA: carboxypeptidase-like regulatory domain-containing protein [Bacteroidia bacterium]|nr:carboxypeptidase-like regulatory domain-containing protein [Bacteroidia bacterium]
MKEKIFLIIVTVLFAGPCLAQTTAEQEQKYLVQFSGVVVTADSLKPLPYVNVIIRHTWRGTVSDYFGFFSFVARMNDTIEFSSLGYKKSTFIIPDTLTSNRYSLIQMMQGDTIVLRETIIYPWPTKEQFKEAFMNLRIPDDDLERAKKNLARAEMQVLYENMPMDGSMNFRNQMQAQQSKLYYAGGQLPPNNLLNPIAWAKFIEAWQNGDYKRKDK